MSARARSASERGAGGPLTGEQFAALMARLGPFEHRPRLAVAVSGGPDSMALCLLADEWAQGRGGEVTALTVDHGLRAGSAAEAERVGTWLRPRGIAHQVLTWHGPKPKTGVQARARTMRYALLAAACRRHDILHLLVAHQLEDQAETVALREARGSGPDGLAAMPAIRELDGLRLLRPLLPVSRERLVATLIARRQSWIDDPANRAPHFTRSRLRQSDLPIAALAGRAQALGARRATSDRRLAAFLAEAASVDPAGFATLSRAALQATHREIASRALTRLLAVVAGRAYPPRTAALGALCEELRARPAFAGRTLAGCRVVPLGERILVCREPAATGAPLPLTPRVWHRFDERFAVRLGADVPDLEVRILGRDGARQRRALLPEPDARDLPGAVRAGLPSIWRGDELLLVPHLRLARAGSRWLLDDLAIRLVPAVPLAGAPFRAPLDAMS